MALVRTTLVVFCISLPLGAGLCPSASADSLMRGTIELSEILAIYEDKGLKTPELIGLQSDARDGAKTFTGSILRLLLLAGYDPTSQHSDPFVSKVAATDDYEELFVYKKMKRVIQRPIKEKPRGVGRALSDIAREARNMAVTKARTKREFYMNHY